MPKRLQAAHSHQPTVAKVRYRSVSERQADILKRWRDYSAAGSQKSEYSQRRWHSPKMGPSLTRNVLARDKPRSGRPRLFNTKPELTKIKKLISKRGKSTRWAGQRLGCSKDTVRNYLRGWELCRGQLPLYRDQTSMSFWCAFLLPGFSLCFSGVFVTPTRMSNATGSLATRSGFFLVIPVRCL